MCHACDAMSLSSWMDDMNSHDFPMSRQSSNRELTRTNPPYVDDGKSIPKLHSTLIQSHIGCQSSKQSRCCKSFTSFSCEECADSYRCCMQVVDIDCSAIHAFTPQGLRATACSWLGHPALTLQPNENQQPTDTAAACLADRPGCTADNAAG